MVVCERSKDETKQLLGCEDGSLVRLLLCKEFTQLTDSSIQSRDAHLQFLVSCRAACLRVIKKTWSGNDLEQGSCKGYLEYLYHCGRATDWTAVCAALVRPNLAKQLYATSILINIWTFFGHKWWSACFFLSDSVHFWRINTNHKGILCTYDSFIRVSCTLVSSLCIYKDAT